MARAEAIRRDWLAKTLAGSLLGLTLGLGCSAVFSVLATGLPLAVRAQLAMWMVAPIWLGTLSGCFFFADGWRAWRGLGLANLVVFGAWALLRSLVS
ncbi:hypothetical protein CKO44_16790 [Rubrivivax gelatinosus]|uniref:hypothetical protein n=1 Tax=Rubrivivax gelatinosus TaxID=28068 RepID=UPI001906CE1A|nr:hypothetical protein [Rubrivivax gelatinosus]MBK1615125.1 hypothetical protein [Rubrivivax gelatinosus]